MILPGTRCVPSNSFLLTLVVCAICVWETGFHTAGIPAAMSQETASTDSFQQKVLPLLEKYCADCHMHGSAEAGVAFDYRNLSDSLQGGKTWYRVMDAVKYEVMPPADMLQPTRDEIKQITSWIDNDLFEAQRNHNGELSAVVMRRLNRQEYNNSIRDLIGLDIRVGDDFPADDIGFGYDNVGSALNVSPVHIEKYFAAAERAMRTAIVLPDVEPYSPIELIGLRTYPLPPDKPVEFEHHLSPGRYLADFSLVRVGIAESVPAPRLLIGFGSDQRTVNAVRIQDETVVYRYWLTVAEGDKQVSVALAPGQSSVVASKEVAANVSGDQRYGGNRGLHVDSMVVRGPVPLPGVEMPESHRALLFCHPAFGDASRRECAKRVTTRFAERAFRRPVSNEEVERIMRIYQLAQDRGESFERATQLALTTVLVAPQFLFLVEPEASTGDRLLTDYELASRLSYFLWSTMPDSTLLKDARQGTLRANIRSQVVRMLADPKSDALVENFVGQWLQLRELENVTPDQDLYPSFDNTLRAAMRSESEQFFAFVVRENRSVLELLTANYTFANDVLARHYGIDGVTGSEFRRVSLSDGKRGGVMTQASVLTLTSNHNRTSPVKRGKWILQQLLGTPPPPPPPGVEQLEESNESSEAASLRERLELHRANPECAACHRQMDPLGFALESYDSIGRWRTSDGKFAIDSSGELLGQRRFQDVQELKKLLMETDAGKFTRCLIENMLIYALGRGLDYRDCGSVELIRRKVADDEFRIQNIIFGIVESEGFQRRGIARSDGGSS